MSFRWVILGAGDIAVKFNDAIRRIDDAEVIGVGSRSAERGAAFAQKHGIPHSGTYQEMLEDKNKEVEDNHRLITELRADRDHYKQGYIEMRDEMEKLSKEFRDFRSETEEERAKMKRDIARNGRQMENMRPFLCYDTKCKKRVRVPASDCEATDKTHEIEPENDI